MLSDAGLLFEKALVHCARETWNVLSASRPLFQTSLLARVGWKVLTGEKVGTLLDSGLHRRTTTPSSAPAQHYSIQPPNTPATSEPYLERQSENGSSSSVGSA